MSKVKLITTLAFCVFLTPAFAQSLGERQARTVEEKTVEGYAGYYGDKCKMTVKFDWSTFNDSAQALSEKGTRPSSFCEMALAGIGRVCSKSQDALKAVQSSVKSLTCKQASPSTLTLENGELVYGMDFKEDRTNGRDKVEKFLMEKL